MHTIIRILERAVHQVVHDRLNVFGQRIARAEVNILFVHFRISDVRRLRRAAKQIKMKCTRRRYSDMFEGIPYLQHVQTLSHITLSQFDDRLEACFVVLDPTDDRYRRRPSRPTCAQLSHRGRR